MILLGSLAAERDAHWYCTLNVRVLVVRLRFSHAPPLLRGWSSLITRLVHNPKDSVKIRLRLLAGLAPGYAEPLSGLDHSTSPRVGSPTAPTTARKARPVSSDTTDLWESLDVVPDPG